MIERLSRPAQAGVAQSLLLHVRARSLQRPCLPLCRALSVLAYGGWPPVAGRLQTGAGERCRPLLLSAVASVSLVMPPKRSQQSRLVHGRGTWSRRSLERVASTSAVIQASRCRICASTRATSCAAPPNHDRVRLRREESGVQS